MSNDDMLRTFQAGEQIKQKALRNLEGKINSPTHILPNKNVRLMTSSVESLMNSIGKKDRQADQNTDQRAS